MVDLGKWMGEEYRVARGDDAPDEQEDELPPVDDGESPKMH